MSNKDPLVQALRKSAKRAIENVRKYKTTDVDYLQSEFEVRLLPESENGINELVDKVVDSLISRIVDRRSSGKHYEMKPIDAMNLQPLRHVLVPKKVNGDFRKCALIDIYDELKYLTLVLSIAKKIEAKRISKKQNRVFSYRFNGDVDKDIFFSEYNFTKFREESRKRSRQKDINVLVECDISKFYDRLNIHRLNSILLSIDNIDVNIVKLIDQIFLYWADRNSYGLPVGSNASRILAEASLIEVDKALAENKINFIRFVDDYRLFAATAEEANQSLLILLRALEREGLFLNSGKTKFRDVSGEFDEGKLGDIQSESSTVSPKIEVISAPTTQVIEKLSGELIKDGRSVFPISSYSGAIPLRYRRPSDAKREKLLTLNVDELIDKCASKILLDEDEFHTIIDCITVQGRIDLIERVFDLSPKSPQFVPFIADMLLKEKNMQTEYIKKLVVARLGSYLQDPSTPEYIILPLLRLFSSKPFENKEIILDAYFKLQRGRGGVVSRAFLESLIPLVSRKEALDIRDQCRNLPLCDVRMVAGIVARQLSKEEARPFLKNLRIQYEDYFLSQINISN